MTYDRKLIRNGNGWALTLNATILEFLGVDPRINKVHYSMENDIKSNKKIEKTTDSCSG